MDPPRDAECIQKWFAGELNPEADEANLRVPPVDYGVPHDATTPPLSHMDPDSPDFVMSVGAFILCISVWAIGMTSSVSFTGKPPHIIPKSVMDTVKIHDGIGYAPNPHYKRGAPKVSVH